MVVSKRKKDNKEPTPTTPEIKRTKIQAQRKFAQGQQPPSSAYLTYNLTSSSETPVKEKSQERELLPNCCPNTEDFLTFLCFRGTSTLPKELDFQNTLSQPSTSGTSGRFLESSPDKSTNSKADLKKKSKKIETITSKKEKDLQKLEGSQGKDPKTGFMPFAVRKRAEVFPTKNEKKKSIPTSKKKHQQQASEEEDVVISEPRRRRENTSEEQSRVTRIKVKKKIKRELIDEDLTTNNSTEQCKTKTESEKVPNEVSDKDYNKSSSKIEEEKRQTRLSSIRNPPSTTPKISATNGNESPELEKYSSSDDSEPLIKSEPKNKKLKIQDSKAKTVRQNLNSSKSQSNSTQVVQSKRGRKKATFPSQSEVEKLRKTSPVYDESFEKNQVKRKKRLKIDQEVANSQANTTDLSENEARGRPTRKTKEAATIYMELIGRKLTLQDSSDNNSSLDSLEVPNLKRVELLENELKANCKKAKEAKAERKKNENNDKIVGAEKTKFLGDRFKMSRDKEDTSKTFQTDYTKNLEKSFSDSDEEPLASKVIKQIAKPIPQKKKGVKGNQEPRKVHQKKKETESLQMKKTNTSKTGETIKTIPQNYASVKICLKDAASPKTAGPSKVLEAKSKQSPDTPQSRKSQKLDNPIKTDDDEFVKGFDSGFSKPITSSKTAINLLPSKEESEKIFGIASITLAQSCGPLDTKCTLGKCGSVHVHKPPTVLTESALGAGLSPKDRRKSKVNMTRDQIQKWLEEASWTPIPDDEGETFDLRTASKASTSSIGFSKYGDDSQSSKEKEIDKRSSSTTEKKQGSRAKLFESPSSTKLLIKDEEKIKSTFPESSDDQTKQLKQLLTRSFEKEEDNSMKNAESLKPSPSCSSVAEKKTPVYQQQQHRRTPVYKADNKTNSKLVPILPKSFGAFSPENEHSIYSFDKEDEDIRKPTTPFRRSNSKARSEIFPRPSSTPNKQSTQPSHVSLTLSPEDHKKSASISVDMKDNSKSENKEKDTENDSDSEGHTFYIPLQASNVSGSKTIQGVAVKLGTEGAEGPNQRIIMHAKLVTKPRANTAGAPLPESIPNVQELVKSLMASKETSKPLPCATVQPRFKSNDIGEAIQPEPSTSLVNQAPKLGVLTDAPVFRPTEKEFQDPIEYIERITPQASRFGICRIIPPESFKPECRVSDEMRFTAYNQYVHKMLHRWGPSSKEFSAIKKYLATQSIVFQRPPLIAGSEVDLPRLYHTVQELGGLKEVIEKKKWSKVAEDMCIPKTAHERVTKLDDIYCKYLLPYDTLSHGERQKLFDEVEADWAKRETKARRNADKGVDSDEQSNDESEESDDENEEDDNASMECMVKGRSMALSQFYRIARNMMTLWFKTPEPTVSEIEAEYWRHVAVRDSHVCVHYGSIDSSGYGYGFPVPGPKTKLSPCSKHPWNLKVLTNNSSSILRSLGPVMGVTVPTLHVGMLFSAVCWYRDPHGLPWIEYLHTGSSKIWYAVPDDQSANFRSALTSLVPSHCQNKTIWLPCDTTMVPPYMLTDRNVSLCRTEQQPGQYVVVFPRAYTSSLCTGYTVSESVYFATNSWLDTAHLDFKDIQESCEPTMFSLEQLLFAIANDQRSNNDTITKIIPMLIKVFEVEKRDRQALKDADVTTFEKIHETRNKVNAEELECNYCRANLHISWIKLEDDDEENVYCLKHSLKYLNDNRIQASQCKLFYTYTIEEIEKLIKRLKSRVSFDVNEQTEERTISFGESSHSKPKGKNNPKKSIGKF